MGEDKLREAVLRAVQKLEKRKNEDNTTDKQKQLIEKDEMSCLKALTGDLDHEQFADLILEEYIKNRDKKDTSYGQGRSNS